MSAKTKQEKKEVKQNKEAKASLRWMPHASEKSPRTVATAILGSVPITGMNVIDAFTKDASVAHES